MVLPGEGMHVYFQKIGSFDKLPEEFAVFINDNRMRETEAQLYLHERGGKSH